MHAHIVETHTDDGQSHSIIQINAANHEHTHWDWLFIFLQDALLK